MRQTYILCSILSSCVAATVTAKASPFQRSVGAPHNYVPSDGLGIAMPEQGASDEPGKGGDESGEVTISDVLGSDKNINIFAGLTRDIFTVSTRLSSSLANTTVLAPLNTALMKLPRKPWEDSKDYEAHGAQAYVGTDGEDRASANLKAFVQAHIVPTSPWEEGKKMETVQGNSIWYETKDGKKTIQPGNVEVDSVSQSVGNGEVWILKGIINYS